MRIWRWVWESEASQRAGEGCRESKKTYSDEEVRPRRVEGNALDLALLLGERSLSLVLGQLVDEYWAVSGWVTEASMGQLCPSTKTTTTRAELTRRRNGRKVISSLVPNDLLERPGDIDLDQTTFLTLSVALGLPPCHLGGLSVLLGVAGVVGWGGGESGEGELGGASGVDVGEEGERGDDVDLGGAVRERMGGQRQAERANR
jgi:hypothetical protein